VPYVVIFALKEEKARPVKYQTRDYRPARLRGLENEYEDSSKSFQPS